MRKSKKNLHFQRKIMEKKLKPWLKLRVQKMPRSGWIRAIRESLGISIRQLAGFLGINQGNVSRLEQREIKKKITLETIHRVAEAMDCKFIYAIVPKDTFPNLDAIVSQQANRLAQEILTQVEHTMRLERQGTGVNKQEKKNLSEKLKQTVDPRIWDKRK